MHHKWCKTMPRDETTMMRRSGPRKLQSVSKEGRCPAFPLDEELPPVKINGRQKYKWLKTHCSKAGYLGTEIDWMGFYFAVHSTTAHQFFFTHRVRRQPMRTCLPALPSSAARWGGMPLLVIAFPLLAHGCGRARTDAPSNSGAGGEQAGDGDGAGGSSIGSGGGDGAGGYHYDYTPLEPTADCVHPDVVENCEGDFCRIEPGCFIMGAPPGEFGRGLVDSDQVQVTLTHPFWIGRTEVTRAQWEKSGLPVPVLEQLNGERECLEPDCPQGNADFYDMLHYANRLSELEGLALCYLFDGEGCTGDYFEGTLSCPQVKINAKNPYECEGYRLPMEAEWEYAARGGTKTAFPTGDITSQKDSGCYFDAAMDAIGWYCMNSPDQARRVALKPPNAWGLHDMHGNLNERVNDLYGPSGYLIGPYGAGKGPLINPTGVENKPDDLTQTKDRRVARGGTHLFEALSANVSRRSNLPDYGSASNLGFRIARTIP